MENSKEKNKESSLQEHEPTVSIQDAFKKFQKQKFYQLKLNKYLKNIEVDRKSPEFKQQLRQKFIETSKKYIGIPYGQRYHQPGDQYYDAPLFIDCCALIRQCIFDLRQQFGYTLAKWNQAYQFDLLPDQGLQESDLKPGDLIFYSATYSNPKLKPFPHKMVHVEIYLGEGKSIGARWQKGTIQVFDSYKFKSNLYYDIEFHYRSIDAWLEGKFESHCQEHKWLDQRGCEWLSEKYSVFADPSLDDITQKQTQEHQIKSICIGKGNNCKLLHQYFSNPKIYRIMSQKQQFSPHFYFKWVQTTGEVDFYSFKEGKQVVNHIPNITVISSKLELLKTLKDLEIDAKTNDKVVTLPMNEFIPKTYRLDVMSDEIEFLNDVTHGIWIYKPRNMNQGKGIRIIADIQQFKDEFIHSKKFYLGEFSLNNMMHYKPQLNPNNQPDPSSLTSQTNPLPITKYHDLKHDGLIQHYLKPLLLNNRKFDIRCYMLINSAPLLVLFHPGYLRLTIDCYNQQDIQNSQNLSIHLTNNSYQYKHKQYKQKKEETIQKWQLIQSQIGVPATKQLKHQIKRILVAVFAAAKRKLMLKSGTYQLLGCDIIVDESNHPYLLEVNTNPAMFTDTQVQKDIIPGVLSNTLDVVMGLFEGGKEKLGDFGQGCQQYGFEMLYCEGLECVYNGDKEQVKVEKDGGKGYKVINGLKHRVANQQAEQGFKQQKPVDVAESVAESVTESVTESPLVQT